MYDICIAYDTRTYYIALKHLQFKSDAMTSKSISMSVRLSPEDASALATLKMADATTPSDKIRALIRLAGSELGSGKSYADQLAFHGDRLGEIYNAILTAEARSGRHSELLAHAIRWLPEMTAFYFANAPVKGEQYDQDQLLQLERGVADRVFTLFEAVLRLAVTGKSPCYDERLIIDHCPTVAALAALISQHFEQSEERDG